LPRPRTAPSPTCRRIPRRVHDHGYGKPGTGKDGARKGDFGMEGIRVYLKMIGYSTRRDAGGDQEPVAKFVGEEAARIFTPRLPWRSRRSGRWSISGRDGRSPSEGLAAFASCQDGCLHQGRA